MEGWTGRTSIECVHMTSRRPCWMSKQRNGGHLGEVKYSFGDWTLFLCKLLLLFHYANMASGHMSEHTLFSRFLLHYLALNVELYVVQFAFWSSLRKKKVQQFNAIFCFIYNIKISPRSGNVLIFCRDVLTCSPSLLASAYLERTKRGPHWSGIPSGDRFPVNRITLVRA